MPEFINATIDVRRQSYPRFQYTFRGLNSGTEYEVYVSAENDIGAGAPARYVFKTPRAQEKQQGKKVCTCSLRKK